MAETHLWYYVIVVHIFVELHKLLVDRFGLWLCLGQEFANCMCGISYLCSATCKLCSSTNHTQQCHN